ncbi:MAG: hypothetical protein CV089_08555 [Nitrospira sp. WS110]|nr:hypothetical protein [Nitrospira sp. WS110]
MAVKPQILIIGPTPPPFHGVAVALETLLQSRIAERFHISHLDLADRRGIQHVNKPDLHDVWLFCRQWTKLIGLLSRERPDVTYLVLSQSTIGLLRDSFLLWPAFLRGSRLVLHLHGGNFRDWFSGRSWLMRVYVRIMLRRVTRILVLGESFKKLFDGLVDMNRVAVVPNGIDWQSPDQSVRQRDERTPCRILHLSTLSHLKGALVLLKSIPLVIRQRRDVEFIFAGPWSHEDDQQWADRFIAQEGIASYVRFTGQVEGEGKQALFHSSDLFVFPGVQQEGQPLVVLEAMAAGLPVVYTDRGCLKETLGDEECGRLVEINDPADLAFRLLWLLDHPEVMETIGRAGRKRYERLFTRENHIAAMMQVFEGVASGCGKRQDSLETIQMKS